MSGPYYIRQFKTTVLLPEINPSNYKWRDIPMIPTYILRVELFWTKTSTWQYLFETNLKYNGKKGLSLHAWYSRVFAVVKFVSCQFVYRFLECCNIRFRSFCKKKKNENQCLFLFEIYQMGPYAELLQWNEKWNFFIQHQNSSNSIKIFSSGLHIRSHWFYFNF